MTVAEWKRFKAQVTLGPVGRWWTTLPQERESEETCSSDRIFGLNNTDGDHGVPDWTTRIFSLMTDTWWGLAPSDEAQRQC